MTTTEKHLQRIKEHLEEINDAIDEGMEKKPITIGFHCSACSIDLLELYLHSTHKIPLGMQVRHNWFKKPKEGQKIIPLAERKIGAEFDEKERIYDLMYTIEGNRETLLYGNATFERVREVYTVFQKLKEILEKKLAQEGIHLEKN